MENKQHTRQSSVPPKGPASDGRKDNGSHQKHQRNQRRRDPAPRVRNEPAPGRRTAPQKSRDFDKRPRSRGYINDRQKEEVTEDRRAELGSVLRPGSKKASLNHLLNFTIAPREHKNVFRGHRSYGNGWRGYDGVSMRYNKERFLQANCQFVVRDNTDYSVHAADPDTLVDWDQIQQVRILSHEEAKCPICLYPPNAAKLTRCGHVYCWSCILHYMSLGDVKSNKCPICYQAIHKRDLKSVVVIETHPFVQDDQITMKLMKKVRKSTHAMPRAQWADRSGVPHNIDDAVDTRYAKLLSATDEQVKQIIKGEKMELERQMKEEGESLEGSFVEAAMRLLMEQENFLDLVMGNNKKKSQESKRKASEKSVSSSGDEITEQPWKNNDVVEYADAFSDNVGEAGDAAEGSVQEDAAGDETAKCDDIVEGEIAQLESELDGITMDEVVEELGLPTEPEKQSGNEDRTHHYYYQADDGQQIYLNWINVRCLLKEYGSWENCPDTITATVVEIEGITMTEELRRRLRHLNHLPVTCQFQVAELALKPPLVSSATLDCFKDDLGKRQKMRLRRLREERQRSRKIELEENKKMGIYPGMRVKISSQRHFPGASGSSPPNMYAEESPSPADFAPVGSPPGLNPNAAEFAPGSPVSVGSSDDGSMSFAQMLRAGKAKPQADVWPKVNNTVTPVTSAHTVRTGSDDSGDEETEPVPVFQFTLDDAIERALNKYKKLETKSDVVAPTTGGGTVGKKKGKKKQLLFTTTMHRS